MDAKTQKSEGREYHRAWKRFGRVQGCFRRPRAGTTSLWKLSVTDMV